MRIKNSLKNIYTGLIGQFITMSITFISRTIFIHTLGSTYLGVSGLFTNILSLFSLAELGVGEAITFNLYRAIADEDKQKICALMNLYKRVYITIGIFILTIGTLFTPLLPYIIKDNKGINNLPIIYILFVINSAASYFYMYRSTFIIANQKNYIISKINYIFVVISNILQIIILLITKNYLAYLSIQIILTIVQNIYISRKCIKMYPFLGESKNYSLDEQSKNTIFRNIKSLMIYKVGTLSLNSTDNIITSYFLDIVVVGLYSNYNLIITSVNRIFNSIFSSLTASIGNLVSKESIQKQIFIFDVIYLFTFWIYGIGSICLFVLLTPFIKLWIGNKYILGIDTVFIISFNFYIAGLLFTPYNFRQTLGLFMYGKWRPIISAILNLIVSIVLVRKIGLSGVLWGTAITRILTNVWFDPYIVYKKGFNRSPIVYYKKYMEYFVITILIGVCCSILCNRIDSEGVKGFINMIIICLTIPNIILILIYNKKPEFIYVKNITKNLIKKIINKGEHSHAK